MNRKEEDEPIYMMLHQLVYLAKYQAFKHLEEFNLKPSQAGILFILSGGEKMSQRKLAMKIGITPPSMTVALRKLEDQGYVEREQDKNDQRITSVFLTEKGMRCVGEIKEAMEQMEMVLYQNVSSEERLLLRRLVAQMRRNLLESEYCKGLNIRTIMERVCHPIHGGLQAKNSENRKER